MNIGSLKQNKTCSYHIVIPAFLIILLISPLSVFSQDPDSIATLRQMGKAFSSIAEKTSPAVVSLKSERTVTQENLFEREWPFGPFSDPFDFFFRSPRQRERREQREQRQPRKESRTAQGSGFLISSDGYILTNNHMVEEAEKIKVELTDGREYTAKIIGTDPASDVAVIKVDDKNLPFLELADSDKLEVGEWVLAIGNPLGLSHTVTAGIVSAKGRSGFNLARFEDFIQTDAAINFGNSGGPLINLDSKVVGINTAIVGAGGNIGIGFAIPINMVKNIYDQLVQNGTVARGFIGIRFEELKSDIAVALGLKEDTKGVTVSDVEKDSPAEKAGLKRYDVIVEFEGKPVENGNEFRNRVALLNPGTKVQMVILRNRKQKQITLTLGTLPSTALIDGDLPQETQKELGFAVEDLTEELAGRYGYEGESGVIVSDVEEGSQAQEKGIATGALIKEVNQQKIRNTKEFNDAINQAKKEGTALLFVKRGRYTFFVPLKLSEK
ncbi:MAG: Do family serine endopeptidase [Sedimentisphaerales bacterium]|nr:Do family serine endopeptidase [Sedimentisphaerales bacterium]